MPLVIDNHEQEGVLTIGLTGSLTFGPEESELRKVFESCLAAGSSRVIVDFEKLSSIDSAGLGTLLLFYVKLRRAGGNMVLLNVPPAHMNLLLFMKLETIFQVFTDEHDAINSFFPERANKHFDVLEFVRSQGHAAQPVSSLEKNHEESFGN